MTSSSANDLDTGPLLFTPIKIRGLVMRNRIIASPMCQYLSVDGAPNDWQLMHLGRLAIGGCGIVFGEKQLLSRMGVKRIIVQDFISKAMSPLIARLLI